MKEMLTKAGYWLHPKTHVWSRPDYSGMAYSDGEEVEERLAIIIEQANDLSVLSPELREHCTDWPSLYHLNGTRANILRPFQHILSGADVLEIGAGCGAITRYLGECGANVVALEGSPRRAGIACSRTRDLLNVVVVADQFDHFQWEQQFDVICLIGVFEYANVFTPGDNSALAMLQRVQALLKPNGKVIIAIENQLGLKYFAGAPEDHMGQPMYGIEGRYRKKQPQTFGRAVLTTLLQRAGFATCELLAPFPDYKFPISILTEAGCKNKDFDAGAFAWQSARRDPQLPPFCNFSLELAWPAVFDNQMALDLANSFLVVASPSSGAQINHDVLAYHYSTERRPEFCKEAVFLEEEFNHISIHYSRLARPESDQQADSLIQFICPDSDHYIFGKLLSQEFIQIVTRDGWSIAEVAAFIQRYLRILEGLAREEGIQVDLSLPHSELPGKFFDAVPQNIIIKNDGGAVLIDKEWSLTSNVEIKHLVLRALGLLIGPIIKFGRMKAADDMTCGQLVDAVLTAIQFGGMDYERYLAIEEKITEQVTGCPSKQAVQWLGNPLLTLNLNQVILERDRQISQLNQNINERNGQIASLIQNITENRQNLEQRLSSLYNRLLTKEGELRHKENELGQARDQLAYFQEECREYGRQLDGIYSSFMWRIMGRVRRLRNQFCPENSRRGRLYESLLNRVKKTPDRPDFQRKRTRGEVWDRILTLGNAMLPLSANRKFYLGSFIFTRFGSLFQSTESYQRWKGKQLHILHDAYTLNESSEGDLPSASDSFSSCPENSSLDFSTLPNDRLGSSTGSLRVMSIETADEDKSFTMDSKGIVPPLESEAEGDTSHETSAVNNDSAVRPLDLVQLGHDGIDTLVQSFNFTHMAQPSVSIVIPVYNQVEYTVCCLASLLKHPPQNSYEVILVDDASDDETPKVLSTIANIHYMRNEQNIGFLQSCNKGAAAARGQFLMVLNNDTQVLEGWLDELVKTFDEFSDVGLVGSKLLYPNGVLQEAGAILKRDGSAELVGLNADASRPEYNVVREVDYCSGACLLMEADLFKMLGGFDESYSPCYCEDSDLAFRVRKMGKRVLYQPRSVIVHHLSVSTNNSKHAKMPLVASHTKFLVQRWGHELKKLNEVRAIAFYLPQFHPIPENDHWWGKGFTEWTNVTKARPNFEGHYQPHLPADLGFYDLRLPEIREEQARLARQYGIFAFCYYYYWFAGKKLLNRPFDEMLQSGAPDFPFCLCWANENWTRRWDGCEDEILIAQRHTEEDHVHFIQDIAPALADARYVRINGKPLLIIYRLGLFPDPKRTADLWREYCINEGIGEVYLAYVQSFGGMPDGDEPEIYGFDAAIEFPPHRYPVRAEYSRPLVNSHYHGMLFDYTRTAYNFINRPWPSYKLFRTVMPSWDNTARRQDVSHVFMNATPERYEYWLRQVVEQTRRLHFGDERMVFINAWNEWAEGNHLEPDRQFGHQYLMATKKALE